MSDQGEPSHLKDLENRLEAARKRHEGASSNDGKKIPTGDFGPAVRVAVDLVAGIVVGVLIGWALDRWLDTRPWLMLLFFVLGAAAGITNVMRTARQIEKDVAARRKQEASRNNRDA